MKRLVLVTLCAFAAACSPPAATESPTTPSPSAPTAAVRGPAIALTAEFLVGSWGDNGDCTAISTFNADGTFRIGEGVGRWTLAGDIITMAGDGGTFELRADALNQNQILIGNPNGSIGLSQRC